MSFTDDILKPDSEFMKGTAHMRLHSRPPHFDPRCYDLAEYFLQSIKDFPAGTTDRLAADIQDLIESRLRELEA